MHINYGIISFHRSYDDRSMSVRIFDDSGFDIGDEINCFSA